MIDKEGVFSASVNQTLSTEADQNKKGVATI
jgi:hypothetical protein